MTSTNEVASLFSLFTLRFVGPLRVKIAFGVGVKAEAECG